MALTRKMLKAMGIDEDKIEQIIEAHTETIDGLKEEAKKNKDAADRLEDVQKELDGLKSGGSWEERYNAEKKAHDDYRAEIAAKESKAAKTEAYRKLLREANVSDKRIETVIKASASLIEGIKLDKDGKIDKAEEMAESIKTEWSDFIVTSRQEGTDVAHPPAGNGGSKLTRADIFKKDENGRYVMSTAERQKALKENPELLTTT